MTTSGLPRTTPGAGSRTPAGEPIPGAPSRALRLRAAAGWLRFMHRAERDLRGATDGPTGRDVRAEASLAETKT
ncbi:hypothetical protein [Streptomyces venezuelae]|uniref:hypothetical protein n=1 Tax=Streptomyces venezuelae TaxID=54571 RepID=UPI00278C61F3|nr:hypothetical protein [Streptomyces venezuelae]